jgi:hypothetical protein
MGPDSRMPRLIAVHSTGNCFDHVVAIVRQCTGPVIVPAFRYQYLQDHCLWPVCPWGVGWFAES